jgi:beta-lactamase regulating signal transducer with metallopeptidase domain
MLTIFSTEQIALGLLHSLWQGGLIGILLIGLLYTTRCPFRRYAYSLGALVLLVVSCIWTIASVDERISVSVEKHVLLPDVIEPVHTDSSTSIPNQQLPSDVYASNAVEMAKDYLGNWHNYLVGTWALGVLLMLGRLGMVSVQAMRLKRRVLPVEDVEIQALFQKLCDQLHITRFVRLRLTNHLESPAVLGVVTPMILLPVHLATSQPIEHLRAILIHELVHVCRYDCLVNALQMIAEIILFYNPAIWLINRQIRMEREAICDHISMGMIKVPGVYIRVLLDVMNGLKSRQDQLSVALVKQGDKSMLDRVRRVLVPDYKPAFRLGWDGVLIILLCLSVLILPSLLASDKDVTQSSSLVIKEQGTHSTIDDTIQMIVHESLLKKLTEVQGESAHAVLVDPGTGEILAMDSIALLKDREVANLPFSSVYEPGSLIKPLVIALALNDGVLTTKDTIDCEQGLYEGPSFGQIKDYKRHGFGTLTAKEILIYSSNIGMAKIGQKLGKERLYVGLKGFGFGKVTGLGLSDAQAGFLKPLKSWDEYTVTRIPFGQGQAIAVTSLQILQAYTAFCNQGRFAALHVDKTFRSSIEEQEPIISPEIADWMRKDVLAAVVNEGTAKRAKLQTYQVFGKTGTALIAKDGRYDNEAYIASFVGGAPAENPRLLVIVSIRRPDRLLEKGYTGGAIAAPVAADILDRSLAYLGD